MTNCWHEQPPGLQDWPFESLLAWKVYPDRVVLIAEDGRKIEIPVSAVESILLEEV